jgi:hypothetical protein
VHFQRPRDPRNSGVIGDHQPTGGWTQRTGPETRSHLASRADMSIGFGIFLFVVGAILAFALNVTVDWIDLNLGGYICMGAGLVVAIIGIILLVRRRQSIMMERAAADPGTGERVTERSTESDPRP